MKLVEDTRVRRQTGKENDIKRGNERKQAISTLLIQGEN
jgi:hypothetical protein